MILGRAGGVPREECSLHVVPAAPSPHPQTSQLGAEALPYRPWTNGSINPSINS